MKEHFSKEILEKAIKESKSKADVLRKIGLPPKGGNYKILTRWINTFQIDCSHFIGQGWSKGMNTPLIKLEDILKKDVNYKSDTLKKRLWNDNLKYKKCEICGIEDWNNKEIVFELHHINGDHYDNRLENLQILCPNCHSQTKTHRGRNTKRNSVHKLLGKTLENKICPVCQKEFKPLKSSTIYCSRECYNNSLKQNKSQSAQFFSKETLKQSCDECCTITEIAEKFNTSRPTIKKYLEQYDLLNKFKEKYDFNTKKVGQYDLHGNLIKEWPSIIDAEKSLQIYGISKCLSNKRRSAGGFIWKVI